MKRIVKKPTERRAEIIKTARDLFLTKDYDKTTMQDFMNYLGIAKGTIYHYFRSKEELLEAVVEDIVNEHLEKMEILIQEKPGNALQKMQALIEAGSKVAAPSVLEKLHERGNEAMHTRLLVATLMKQAPIYAKLIQQGCEEGIFQTNFPLECAEFILSAVQFLTDLGICPWSQEDLTRRNQAFPKLIEQLLQAPPNSFQFMLKNLGG
jgi:AcrR family transcriptional regulator